MPKKGSAKSAPRSRKNLAVFSGIALLGLILSVGTVLFARSDEGVIDVTAALTNSNAERRAEDPSAAERPVPRATQNNVPNGGLVGKGKSSPPPTPAPDESASTSDDILQDEDENGNVEDTDGAEEVREGETAEVEEDPESSAVEEGSENDAAEEVIE